ncbi:putative repeat protein (TIGR03847 family) [Kribbella orskensis]|uniref:Repeat protein (TIGR03847 family) n=1 Tax=Kribbella orskensis TaxID=2512216 RepID=A0ABY2BGW2_9ACTN|nr:MULTISPECIES: DUF3090 family protein [Kribbella]TCN38093.1 putative repeat protein (TIGR03847 family) [Kribbella sp. VKM Ac-2500]TCO19580.1 putative repeat protein (TIGR03847 family) [Kribbella orskensis]
MARVVHSYDDPDRFVAGTVGEPGARTFFLQARAGARLTSVACEKEQVMALAERLDVMLDEVARRFDREPSTPVGMDDTDPLEQPIEEEFRAGTMTLAWEADAEKVVIEVFAVVAAGEQAELEETDPVTAAMESDDAEVFIVRISEEQARAFARRAVALVASGRPSCPFCGRPIDPEGHICPRANGYRRHVRE